MWSAAVGESLDRAETYAQMWKATYLDEPSEDLYYWLEYGYNHYDEWLERGAIPNIQRRLQQQGITEIPN